MLDTISILVSCIGCLVVAWRALRLDRALPWFTPLGQPGRQPRRSQPLSNRRR